MFNSLIYFRSVLNFFFCWQMFADLRRIQELVCEGETYTEGSTYSNVFCTWNRDNNTPAVIQLVCLKAFLCT